VRQENEEETGKNEINIYKDVHNLFIQAFIYF
jgi:hypothetical protein